MQPMTVTSNAMGTLGPGPNRTDSHNRAATTKNSTGVAVENDQATSARMAAQVTTSSTGPASTSAPARHETGPLGIKKNAPTAAMPRPSPMIQRNTKVAEPPGSNHSSAMKAPTDDTAKHQANAATVQVLRPMRSLIPNHQPNTTTPTAISTPLAMASPTTALASASRNQAVFATCPMVPPTTTSGRRAIGEANASPMVTPLANQNGWAMSGSTVQRPARRAARKWATAAAASATIGWGAHRRVSIPRAGSACSSMTTVWVATG